MITQGAEPLLALPAAASPVTITLERAVVLARGHGVDDIVGRVLIHAMELRSEFYDLPPARGTLSLLQ